MGIFSDDIVRDILERVVRAAQRQGGFDEALAEQIEQQVREDWHGPLETYIARVPASARISRDEKIQALWDSGRYDARQIAARFGLSVRQVRRIVDR